METVHIPVLLKEVLEHLDIEEGRKYIDATLGGGGHTEAIAQKGGIVLAIDQDEKAVRAAEEKLKGNKHIVIRKGNFSDIKAIAAPDFTAVNGILFDLGLSSDQLEQSGRGFSFLKDEALDMRMDTSQAVTAANIVNTWSEEELYELFTKVGEEEFSRPIIDVLVRSRKGKPLTSSKELAELIAGVKPRIKGIHPATKVFMALRIAVNDELGSLKKGLASAKDLLLPQGKIAVISFHSLEDRIVKNTFREWEETGLGKVETKKPIIGSEEEIKQNKRARSAKLRVFTYEKN